MRQEIFVYRRDKGTAPIDSYRTLIEPMGDIEFLTGFFQAKPSEYIEADKETLNELSGRCKQVLYFKNELVSRSFLPTKSNNLFSDEVEYDEDYYKKVSFVQKQVDTILEQYDLEKTIIEFWFWS